MNYEGNRIFNVEPSYISTPESSEFVTIFRNKLDGLYYGRKSDGTDEPLSPNIKVNISNTIFVDPIYGNDITAEKYNLRKPYLTISAALAVAISGDIINLSKGTHTITSNILNSVADFNYEPGAILQNLSTSRIFIQTNGSTLNIYGQGQLLITASGAFAIESAGSSTINIQADLIRKSTNIIGGAFLCVTAGKINAWVKEVDCSSNFLNIAECLDAGSKMVLNCDVAKFSWFGYLISSPGAGSFITANVKNTICYDMTGNAFGGTYAGIVNGGVGEITINGDLSSANLIDIPHVASGLLNIHNNGNGIIRHNGNYSKIRSRSYCRIFGSVNGKIYANSDIENIQGGASLGLGIYLDSGLVTHIGKIKTSDTNSDPVIQYSGGSLVLSDSVLIANAAAVNSINSAAPITMKVYKAFTNKVVNVNVTNSIVSTAIIVDAGVE